MKCEFCGEKLKKTFLDKLKGTMVKTKKGLKWVCPNCQKQGKTKELINRD